jgi:hypothetical protein
MGFTGIYPLVICYIAIKNGHRNSELSLEKWWIFPVRYVTNYQRIGAKNGGISPRNEDFTM